jgi:Uma2 family endonuclease
MAAKTQLTIDDFERLPDELAHNHELVDGELIDVSGNTFKHNLLRDFIGILLSTYVRKQGLGVVVLEQEYDFAGNAHGPDITFAGRDKKDRFEDRRVQRFVPDLAIEIVSQNDTFEALVKKKERYRTAGTSEVWIISRAVREVYVYSNDRDTIIRESGELSTPLLPGLSISVKDLFDLEFHD